MVMISLTQKRAQRTQQSRYPGAQTQIMRTPGSKTQVVKVPFTRKGSEGIASSFGFARRALLIELVANTFLSKFPPGSSVYGVPGDSPTHKRAQTTAKNAMVTQQGGVFPGKKHQRLHDKKIKAQEKKRKKRKKHVRDAITKEMAATQPTAAGGVLSGIAMLKRTALRG